MAVLVHTGPAMKARSSAPTWPKSVLIVFLFLAVQESMQLVSESGYNLRFSESVFICLLPVCIASFLKGPLKSLPHFLLNDYIFLINLKQSFIYPESKTFLS